MCVVYYYVSIVKYVVLIWLWTLTCERPNTSKENCVAWNG